MKTYTIDNENHISVFATAEEAAAATATPFDSFASQQELAELAAVWPADRLVAIWSSLPSVTPVKKFQDRAAAVHRIWNRIQTLGGTAQPQEQPPAAACESQTPQAAPQSSTGAKSGKAAAKAKASQKASPAKAAKAKKNAPKEASAPRPGTKMAQVIAMMQRKNGASLSEIMSRMNWQKHTVRGFMAGAMKKAGYTVESFKPEGGERSYRLAK